VDGLLTVTLALSTREAREFALAVLEDQGPYLAFQPPNESLRDYPSASRTGPQPWQKRRAIEIVTNQLKALREEKSEAVLVAAIRTLGY
jgi:hypothetical protein